MFYEVFFLLQKNDFTRPFTYFITVMHNVWLNFVQKIGCFCGEIGGRVRSGMEAGNR